jgi:hypothetical protein
LQVFFPNDFFLVNVTLNDFIFQVILEFLWLAACQVVPDPAAGFADKVAPVPFADKDLHGDQCEGDETGVARRLNYDSDWLNESGPEDVFAARETDT